MRTVWRCLPIAVLAVVTASCSDKSGDKPSTDGETPVRGGTVVVAGQGDFDNLNSLVSAEKFSQEVNREMLFLPLIRYTKALDYEPALAQSWKLLGDTGVVFYLRNDVRWHDSQPTTAADVLFTYERAKDSTTAFPNAEYFQYWKSATLIDSLTIQFTWERHAEPLAGLPFLPIMPKHLLDSVPAANMRTTPFNKHPIGNGPFKFVEYRANDRWTFEANKDYSQELGGPPLVDRLVWRIIPDATAQIAEIQTGNVDLVVNAKSDQLKTVTANPDVRVYVKPGRQFANIVFNGKRAPFDQPSVRRAMSLAIDRQAILQVLRAGYGSLAVGPIGPYHWAFDSTLTALPYSPDSAKALLKAANIYDRNNDGIAELPDGRQFVINVLLPANSIINRDMAEMITSNLKQVGAKVVAKPTEGATMFATISSPERDFDAVIVAWESDFRINLRDTFHSGALAGPFQLASYSNPRVDALIDSVAKVTDRAAAKKLYGEIQRIIREEQPWTFLYYYPDLFFVRSRLHGVEMDIRASLVNVTKWWLTGGGQGAGPRSDSAGRTPGPDSAPAR